MTQIYPLFSSPVYHVDDIGYRPSDELIATLESLPSSKSWSHSGLTKDERILDREDMQELKGICQHYLSDYIKTVCGYKENFIITNSWLSRNPKFQGHNQHNHANSIFSGCLYLKANKDTAPIQFRSKNRLSKDFNFACLNTPFKTVHFLLALADKHFRQSIKFCQRKNSICHSVGIPEVNLYGMFQNFFHTRLI